MADALARRSDGDGVSLSPIIDLTPTGSSERLPDVAVG
jgi:hypothetical protein